MKKLIFLISLSVAMVVQGAPKKLPFYGPTEKEQFITHLDREDAPKGLDGANIAMWQSHGWYYEPKLDRWEWQRARLFQTVEDLYTQSYVMPFLMPMLENAGANVMSPRERDVTTFELVIDMDTNGEDSEGLYVETEGKWKNTETGYGFDEEIIGTGVNPFATGTARQSSDRKARATYTAPNLAANSMPMAVYVSYQTLPKSTSAAVYTVHSAAGDKRVKVNQKMGGGTWIYIGHYPFDEEISIEVENQGGKGTVLTADAVKIGGGMGNVGRRLNEEDEYTISRYPRFTEGARYWLQYAGAPDSVYSESGGVNDYTDDYRSRGMWVNWLAGGSSMMPKDKGLNIPVDLSFAFHSDAGTTKNDTVIGTLGIYCTQTKNPKGTYPNGTAREVAGHYTDLVMTNIVNDIRAQYEPDWTRRDMWNKSYFEARVPEVPAMLLELLSHQNFADMKYGLDPTFRFTVSRAIYKGMLKFLAERDGRDYVVQPLPVRGFAINGGEGRYRLTWAERVDELEPSATPTYYVIEERVGESTGFRKVAKVTKPEYEVEISDNEIHSYRIIAGNAGGVSFPSEVLALCDMPGAAQVMIVNGFTRISAPDWFDSGDIAGFYDVRDHGVAYIQDISYIGTQFEFRRDIPWMDDDASGFGASRANYEDCVLAGNTFDYPAVHGASIRAAGNGFVSASVEWYQQNGISAAKYPMIDLIMGKQKEIKRGRGVYGTYYKTYPKELQEQLRRYTSEGGSVFVSGAFIATDLWDNPYSSEETAAEDQKFATEVLGYHWRVGQAAVEPWIYEVRSRFKEFDGGDFYYASELNDLVYAAESPDSFYAADRENGATIMRYGENNLIAGIAYAPEGYRTVCIGVPFETLTVVEQRDDLMKQIINFLIKK